VGIVGRVGIRPLKTYRTRNTKPGTVPENWRLTMNKQFGMVDVLALAVALAAVIFFIEGFIYGGI
jgi:hypothetical protein